MINVEKLKDEQGECSFENSSEYYQAIAHEGSEWIIKGYINKYIERIASIGEGYILKQRFAKGLEYPLYLIKTKNYLIALKVSF